MAEPFLLVAGIPFLKVDVKHTSLESTGNLFATKLPPVGKTKTPKR